MKWSILLALVACIFAGCNGTSDVSDRPLERLKAYRGRDLEKLSEAERAEFDALLNRLMPNVPPRRPMGLYSHQVWEFPNNANPRVVLFEADRFVPHPGSTRIRITVFEDSGIVAKSAFDTGHRCYMSGVSLQERGNGEEPLVVVESGSMLGPNWEKQFYARFGDRFDLVRLEDPEGKASRNRYDVTHFACGPAVPNQTESEWEADLASADRLRVLRALMWLGGSHLRLQQGDERERWHESPEHIQLVGNLRANPNVIARLKELVRSDDPWVRDAAELAADQRIIE
jgi:hypothetical protein